MLTSWVRAPASHPACAGDLHVFKHVGQGHLVCMARRGAAAPVCRKHTPAARLACIHSLPLNRDLCPLSAPLVQKLG